MQKHGLLTAVLGLLFVIPTLAQANEFIDTGTVRNDMHSCPLGTAMTGLRIDYNWLLCSSGDSSDPLNLDTPSEMVVPLASSCPNGYVMTGVRVDRQLMACTYSTWPQNGYPVGGVPPSPTALPYNWYTIFDADGAGETVRAGMHACPGFGTTFMTTIRGSGDNDFTCGWWQVYDPIG